MGLTTMTALYISHVIPFEDPLVHKLEIFNEVCTNIMFSIIYSFAIVPEKDHNTVGFVFMGIIIVNVCTHLYFLMTDILK